MANDIEYVTYEVLENGVIVHRGKSMTIFLHTITDMYCDYEGSPYTMRIYYKGKTIDVSKPKDLVLPRWK